MLILIVLSVIYILCANVSPVTPACVEYEWTDENNRNAVQWRSNADKPPCESTYDVRLADFPNYSTTINLRNTTQFRCAWWPGTKCTVVLTPPDNHGLIIIVQQLNLRLSTSTSPNSDAGDTCRDYLQVHVDGGSNANGKLCGNFDRKRSHSANSSSPSSSSQVPNFVRDSIRGPTQFVLPPNSVARLTLFHDDHNQYDELFKDKWDMNEELGGLIAVTSYFDCSNLTAWQRLGYKSCTVTPGSTSGAGSQCISSSLFCDGSTNCDYDETQAIFGPDERYCQNGGTTSPTVSSTSLLLAKVYHLLPTRATTTTTIRPRPSVYHRSTPTPAPTTTSTTTTTTTTEREIPVYTYNDIRRTKTYPEGSSYLSIAFVLIIFATVVILTLCLGCLKLPTTHSNNYATNVPLGIGRRARARAAVVIAPGGHPRHPNFESGSDDHFDDVSIDIVERIIAVTAPPPEYREASGLPSYDSLFVEGAAAPAPVDSSASGARNASTSAVHTISHMGSNNSAYENDDRVVRS